MKQQRGRIIATQDDFGPVEERHIQSLRAKIDGNALRNFDAACSMGALGNVPVASRFDLQVHHSKECAMVTEHRPCDCDPSLRLNGIKIYTAIP
jgi:hypothetical protein